MRTTATAATIAALLLAPACSDDGSPGGGDPGQLGELVERALADIGTVSPTTGELEYQIYELDDTELDGDVTAESCDAVDQSLAGVCDQLYQAGEVAYCGYTTSFFYAHQVPRCAVRFELYSATQQGLVHPTYVLDFAGTPLSGPAPLCGNAVVDDGEGCDDGNHELWDGCDSNCEVEPFTGCETVIENIYRQLEIAEVEADDFVGPRSHLMVNPNGRSMRPMDAQLCTAAIATGTDVCAELTQQMPFISWCQAGGQFHDDACSIRLQVYFQSLDEDFGVYTTSLPGLLAFTIR
jgi:cysteine-rich repeat protein